MIADTLPGYTVLDRTGKKIGETNASGNAAASTASTPIRGILLTGLLGLWTALL